LVTFCVVYWKNLGVDFKSGTWNVVYHYHTRSWDCRRWRPSISYCYNRLFIEGF